VTKVRSVQANLVATIEIVRRERDLSSSYGEMVGRQRDDWRSCSVVLAGNTDVRFLRYSIVEFSLPKRKRSEMELQNLRIEDMAEQLRRLTDDRGQVRSKLVLTMIRTRVLRVL